MELKKILPMKWNFEIKNCREYLKKPDIAVGKKMRTIYFLDAASYNNLGDQAIAYSMAVMLEVIAEKYGYNYVEISEMNLLRNLRLLKRSITSEDFICLSGGGNMGNLYPKYESIRRKVIEMFADTRIMIFPQTIDYETDRYGRCELNNSIRIYNRHNHLFICAREKKSYEYMSKIYKNVILVPDIVLSLCGQNRFNLKENSGSKLAGLCLREDKESTVSKEEREKISGICSDIGYKSKKLTTMSGVDFITDKEERYRELNKKLEEFKSCRIVVTDRLHGMIFCILAGVPCIAIDNSNKKVSGVLETVGNVSGVISADIKTVKEAIEAAGSMNACMPDISGRFSIIEKIIKGGIN